MTQLKFFHCRLALDAQANAGLKMKVIIFQTNEILRKLTTWVGMSKDVLGFVLGIILDTYVN